MSLKTVLLAAAAASTMAAQTPTLTDPNLAVRTHVSGLTTPTTIAFLAHNDILVCEKATGMVKRVQNGAVTSTPLDLAVNSASERGLLGIALDPDFKAKPFVYLFWTESSTGADSTNVADVPLLGNRVDRYWWNGSSLTWDRNLIRLRAFQADAGQPVRGNHNGGILAFGKDEKLYVMFGDNGRRGFLQNNLMGPVPDDQFGGPEPDDAHLTGVILRLNRDGSAPSDNPFYEAGARMNSEAGRNLQKVFAYGIRNSFGMAVDPYSGHLWEQENGDDSFDEINRVEPGMNGGWVQIIGPVSRISEFKAIETALAPGTLQQLRWPVSNIANTPGEALSRLYMVPGAHYSDPEFSWKYAVAPAAIGFVEGRELGPQYRGDLIVGASTPRLLNGYLFRFNLTGNRRKIGTDDPRLEDRVADNTAKFDRTESENLIFGQNFGIATDIRTGPNGNLYVVNLIGGAIYEIYRVRHDNSGRGNDDHGRGHDDRGRDNDDDDAGDDRRGGSGRR